MYRDNSCCKLPPDDTPVWRYLDFAKFVALLDSGSLFFPSADSLEDPLEGAIPWPIVDRWPRAEAPWQDAESARAGRDLVLINSWHVNTDESIAMWKLYSRSAEALAVRTTVGRLKEALALEDRLEVYLSQVEYMGCGEDFREERGALMHYLWKAKPYSYESEVRALVDLRGRRRDDELVRTALRERGLSLRVDLGALIEDVYISPFSGVWFRNLCASVSRKYELRLEPKFSVLTGESAA